MSDETPTPGPPLPLMTDEEIFEAARDVVTNVKMLADALDRDWQHSLMLMLCGWDPIPSNASTLFLVPVDTHMGGRWLNGKVPAVTLSARPVPAENTDALVAKCDELYAVLYPERKADGDATDADQPG
jgi:hypothetical protein